MPTTALRHSKKMTARGYVAIPALDGLQNQGLIFRQQGKGALAHGRSTRKHRYLAVVFRGQHSAEDRLLAEFLRGAYSFMKSLKAGLVLVEQTPKEWTSELTRILTGAIIVPENVTSEDLEFLRNRNLPFLLWGETELTGPRIQVDQDIFTSEEAFKNNFFRGGEIVAEALNRATRTGEPLGNLAFSWQYDASNLEWVTAY